MPAPVRQQIIDIILTRLRNLAWVGKVVEAATPDDKDDGAGGNANDLTPVLVAGRCVVEFVSYDSVPYPEQTAIDIDAFAMDVVLIVHLPTLIPNDLGGNPQLPSQYAAALCADLYKLHQPDPNSEQTFNGLSLRSDPGPGGGVGITDRGTVGTAYSFNVIYRHTRGSPEMPR